MSRRDWFDEAFFEEPEGDSVDGAKTDHGPLWHAITPRWGQSMHTMCSYHGMFPARLVHYFIQRYTEVDDVVLDPFSGRGTTTLQARVEGRQTISNDLNPLAYVLTRAKAAPPTWLAVNAVVDRLERSYNKQRVQSDPDVPADIEMLFHKETLKQLVFIRGHLLHRQMSTWNREQFMIAGAMAGILHGSFRTDGTSRYLSIPMPNTFSMSPGYVRKFIREKGLKPPQQNVFERLREKLARLYLDALPGVPGTVRKQDAASLLNRNSIPGASIDLLLTSPPYLKVVNYGTANWIRLWWLGLDGVARNNGAGRRALNSKLDHQHNYFTYKDFMLRIFRSTRRVLSPSGVAVFVIGDVATPGGTSMALARRLWDDLGPLTGLRLLEVIEDSLPQSSKVSRIWGETKGQATERDCVLVLARNNGEPYKDDPDIDWSEPYKDGGPDAAHERLRRERVAS